MKGQAALEFLMIYGWAILAVVLMVGTVLYYGALDVRVFSARCIVDPPFSCMEHKADSSGVVQLSLMNGGRDIAYANITLDCGSVQRSYEQALVPPQTRLNGSVVYFSCPVTGDTFSGDIDIEYRYASETVFHTSSGSVRAEVNV